MSTQTSNSYSATGGKRWLNNVPFASGQDAQASPMVVVEIPDVNSVPVFGADPAACNDISETIARALNADASQSSVGQPTQSQPKPVQAADTNSSAVSFNDAMSLSAIQAAMRKGAELRPSMGASIPNATTMGFQNADSNVPGSRPFESSPTALNVVGDVSEQPREWTQPPDPSKSSRTAPAESSPKESGGKALSPKDESISTLVGAILDRFPVGDPTVLVFVGSEENIHTDETCARVASQLSEHNIGGIMLIDSDTKGKALTLASGLEGKLGIADVVNRDKSWADLVYGRSSSGLDFMCVGTDKFHHYDSQERQDRLRAAISEMKKEYQFVCISAGDAHGKSARIWSDICDGTYLLVSMKNTNETIAKSAVAELQSSGARLLGCVVTDAI